MDGHVELLRLLQEHQTEHPDGCSETDLMQRSVEFTLRTLRRAEEELEAEGQVHRASDGRGSYLVGLLPTPNGRL
jgi:hypothetical protein